jgi:hypothetical protein
MGTCTPQAGKALRLRLRITCAGSRQSGRMQTLHMHAIKLTCCIAATRADSSSPSPSHSHSHSNSNSAARHRTAVQKLRSLVKNTSRISRHSPSQFTETLAAWSLCPVSRHVTISTPCCRRYLHAHSAAYVIRAKRWNGTSQWRQRYLPKASAVMARDRLNSVTPVTLAGCEADVGDEHGFDGLAP